MLNMVILTGRMTKDAELRYTGKETPICTFSLACERDRKNPDGERETDFIDCTAWRGTAEFVSRNMKKGMLVSVTGRLSIRKWVSNEGQNRTAPEVIVENVYFAESRKKLSEERPPFPGDADAPPEMDNTPPHDIDQLVQDFPGLVEVDDGDGALLF